MKSISLVSRLSPNRTAEIVCNYFSITMNDLEAKKGQRKNSDARGFFCYLMFLQRYRIKDVQLVLGNYHHSTVLYHEKRIATAIDPGLVDHRYTLVEKLFEATGEMFYVYESPYMGRLYITPAELTQEYFCTTEEDCEFKENDARLGQKRARRLKLEGIIEHNQEIISNGTH